MAPKTLVNQIDAWHLLRFLCLSPKASWACSLYTSQSGGVLINV